MPDSEGKIQNHPAESERVQMPKFLCPRCEQIEDTRPFIGPCAICRLELKQIQAELERVRLIDGFADHSEPETTNNG